ncbi:hypothetical protein KKA13_02295 [Patescibacteria group bacterium]|nr:hypothetical protein [Patescibacteria group bacterium]
MEEGKKSFFDNLEPKTALIGGVVAGALLLCTIGFIVLVIAILNGNVAAKNGGAEIVDNQGDENSVAKSDRPTAELFVMSYCPYGLQMEKAFLPVMQLLSKRADLSIKFVSYAMHGKTELDENTRQYCIQAEQPDKFLAYMNCFVGKDDYKACLTTAKVDQVKMNKCFTATDKKFGITTKFNDASTWLSGRYPLYPVQQELNDQYGVQGSPTLIVNGSEVQADRTPEAVKQAVCAAFNNPPEECKQALSKSALQAGFGTAVGADTGTAACGN